MGYTFSQGTTSESAVPHLLQELIINNVTYVCNVWNKLSDVLRFNNFLAGRVRLQVKLSVKRILKYFTNNKIINNLL